MRLKHKLAIGLAFAAWGTVHGLGMLAYWQQAVGHAPWFPFVLNHVLGWLFWLACLPLILAAARRFNFRQGQRSRGVAVHLVLSLVLSGGQTLFFVFTGVAVWTGLGSLSATDAWNLYQMPNLLYQRIPSVAPVYWMILAAYYAWQAYAESRDRQERALQLERQLAHSRLEALESQLQPHFLFNALHAILSLTDEGRNKQAAAMLMGLSNLLRQRLAVQGEHEVALRQELVHVETYLSMIRARHGERLQIELQVNEETRSALVPVFVLQPLLENAVRHGVEQVPGPHTIRVTAGREDGSLLLEVANTGQVAETTADWTDGVGLGNTRDRLKTLYGAAQALEFESESRGWTVVRLRLPFRLTPGELGLGASRAAT